MLTNENILRSLCWYDKRHPDYVVRDDEREPRVDCACDNCHNRRDVLALEILRLQKLNKKLHYSIDVMGQVLHNLTAKSE